MCVRISSTLLFYQQDELTLQSRMIHAISSFSFSVLQYHVLQCMVPVHSLVHTFVATSAWWNYCCHHVSLVILT